VFGFGFGFRAQMSLTEKENIRGRGDGRECGCCLRWRSRLHHCDFCFGFRDGVKIELFLVLF
jgi:hypothetical protein